MSTTQPIEVKKDGLRQMQDGTWKLSLTVHPNDMMTSLMTAPMGTRYGMALVEIGDDEQPVEKPKRKPAETRAELARRVCGVVAFQEWIYEHSNRFLPTLSTDYTNTSLRLKFILGIEHTAELDTDPEAAKRWDALYSEYLQQAGRMAEKR